MTTFGFGDGKGPVAAHKHPNGGGWVADTAYVGITARVFDTARVSGNAVVSGNTWVSGNAQVYGNARVYGVAQVSLTPPRVFRSDGYDFHCSALC